jgi:hypothetical protein
MSTPAERIYEAAVERTVEQQATLGRLTTAVSGLVAAALAALVLLKPATDGIENAEWPQIVGLGIAVTGVATLMSSGYKVLSGIPIPGPRPDSLFKAARGAKTLERPDDFHLEAAASLEKPFVDSHKEIERLRGYFKLVIIGLALELFGLLFAGIIWSGAAPPKTAKPPPAAAALHLARGYLNRREMGMSGELAAGAQGRVEITVTLLGRGGQAISLDPAVHGGRFAVRVPAAGVAPLRSASYTITWAGSSSVAGASLAGELARCPEDCQ